MRCNYYPRKDSSQPRFVVYLYYRGKKWTRTWDDQGLPIDSAARADRICALVDADMERLGKAFRPEKWFGYGVKELQFETYASKWLKQSLETGRYARGTIPALTRYVAKASQFFTTTDLRVIRQAHIKDYLSSLSGYAPATKQVALDFLHALLADAQSDYEDIIKVPGFPTISIPEQEVLWITEEWQERVIAEIPERDRPIFRFLCAWPNRPGEARALKWDCVYLEKRLCVIKRKFSGNTCKFLDEYTKTKLVRYMPISDDLDRMFKSIQEERKRAQIISPFVFLNRKGKPYTGHINDVWLKARIRSGCPEAVDLYHGTKHSFITQHSDQLALAQKAAGHTNIRQTRRYEGRNVENLRKLERRK